MQPNLGSGIWDLGCLGCPCKMQETGIELKVAGCTTVNLATSGVCLSLRNISLHRGTGEQQRKKNGILLKFRGSGLVALFLFFLPAIM